MAPSPTSRRAREIFEDAIECDPPDGRGAFVSRACGSDTELLRRVEALLKASDDAESMLPNEPQPPAFSSAAGEQPGDCIGRYKLLEKIGEGGCGIVYMAEQEEPVRRRVALKLIKPGMDSKSVIARFEAERQALAMMDHPNIAKVHDGGVTGERSEVGNQMSEVSPEPVVRSQRSEVSARHLTSDLRPPTSDPAPPSVLRPLSSEPGRPYFVMELVRGIRITQYCQDHGLNTRQRLDLFTAVCSAVQHAHQKGIIHRDLKPSNILVTELDGKPVPKVIDFGIAKATEQKLTDKTLFTQFAQFVGTPAYMSPEQAALSGADIDTRSDIYSLGVLLYELLTGTTPFDAKELLASGLEAMCRTIRDTDPPKPSTRITQSAGRVSDSSLATRHSSLAGDLDCIVMKALEKDRARRYETASSLAQDVQCYLNDEPVTARLASAAYRFRKTVRRHKTAFAAAAAVLAALIAGLSVSTWMFFREKHARENERQALERAVIAEKAQSAERQKAETQAEKSRQVAQFLKDMLKGAGPSVALGEDTKMLRRILDSTATRLGNDLKAQPEVEVKLREVIGTVYGDIGDYQKAVSMFKEALEIARRIHGPEHAEVSELLNNLANELSSQGKLQEAETMLHKSLAMKRRLGVDRRDVASGIDNIALVLADRGRFVEAEKLHREALALKRELPGDEHEGVATSLNNLAVALQQQQKFGEAETALREALDIERKGNGADTPLVATTLNNLANVVQYQNRTDESEKLFREVLALQRKFLGNAHPNVATALNGLGLALHEQGKNDEAEPLLREGIEIEKKTRSDAHPQTARLIGNHGRILQGLQRLDEAEACYREALTILEKLEGKEHPDAASWRNRLTILLGNQMKWPEVETMRREVLAAARRAAAGGGPHLGVAEALIDLAYPLVQQNKFTDAEAVLVEGHAALQQIPEAPKDLHRYALAGLVRLYETWKLPEKAAGWQQKLNAFDKEAAPAAGEPKTGSQSSNSNKK